MVIFSYSLELQKDRNTKRNRNRVESAIHWPTYSCHNSAGSTRPKAKEGVKLYDGCRPVSANRMRRLVEREINAWRTYAVD